MTVHASLEQLSSYLDRELAEGDRAGLEEHLGYCLRCRGRLDGLRGVVTRLESLEQQAPPRDLALLVERQVAAERDRGGLRSRMEEVVKSLVIQPSLTPLFGLVVALALILYLFSFGVARHERGGTRLVVPGPAPERPHVTEIARSIEGREFVRTGELWVERGLERVTEVERLDLRAAGEVPEELAPFAELGGPVRLTRAGRAVLVLFP